MSFHAITKSEIYFRARRILEKSPLSLRDVKAAHIGKLVVVRGIVIRTSLVQPMINIATYTCEKCGYENYQVLNSPLLIVHLILSDHLKNLTLSLSLIMCVCVCVNRKLQGKSLCL